ncbi:hypothetical protein EVAR_95030_1 [Eumeta japonica]|uniref:Uncharacterized protein n=1 Tax=Eumeta variegata TaxID=151549 RepID=A0A4C1VTJ8_EUMVA|nr:hypothetical protein EVAR_95030_1 [Eumeta japonica]
MVYVDVKHLMFRYARYASDIVDTETSSRFRPRSPVLDSAHESFTHGEYDCEVADSAIVFFLVSESSGGVLPFHHPTPSSSILLHQVSYSYLRYRRRIDDSYGIMSVHERR